MHLVVKIIQYLDSWVLNLMTNHKSRTILQDQKRNCKKLPSKRNSIQDIIEKKNW